MITLNMTAGVDKDVIAIIKIEFDDVTLYFSDTKDKITLSSIDFDGKVILKDSISEAVKDIQLLGGGTIGQRGFFEFSLARYTSYNDGVTTYNSFMNDFYPATGKPLLTSRRVSLGIIWKGATTISQITWLKEYYIQDYNWDNNSLNFVCIEYDELSAKQLPEYEIQKIYDDGISYYPPADEENIGNIIPLIYGDFSLGSDVVGQWYQSPVYYSKHRLVPVTLVNSDFIRYKIASHKCSTVGTAGSDLFEVLGDGRILGELANDARTNALTNTQAGASGDLTTYEFITMTGKAILQARGGRGDFPELTTTNPGATPADIANIGNMFDTDSETYMLLAPGEGVGFTLNSNLTDADIKTITLAYPVIEAESVTGANDIRVTYYHPYAATTTGGVDTDMQYALGDISNVTTTRGLFGYSAMSNPTNRSANTLPNYLFSFSPDPSSLIEIGATYTTGGKTWRLLYHDPNDFTVAFFENITDLTAPAASGTLTKVTGNGDASIDFSGASKILTIYPKYDLDNTEWTIEELQDLVFVVTNISTNSSPIKIFNCYMLINYDINRPAKKMPATRNMLDGRGVWRRQFEKKARKTFGSAIGELCREVKGRQFGGWIA